MAFRVQNAECIGLVLPLQRGFELSFGVFHALARVVVRITAEAGSRRLVGLGEASIDFPFSPYDAFDIMHALGTTPLAGLLVENRQEALDHLVGVSHPLADCPAALCALNEAFDDIEGHVRGVPVVELYGPVRPLARCMQSIGISSQQAYLRDQVLLVVAAGRTPKPKVGVGVEKDAETIAGIESLSDQIGFRYVLDFNGAYTPGDFLSLIENLAQSGHLPVHATGIEQPSMPDFGVGGLVQSYEALRDHGVGASVIADESFMNSDDAAVCAAAGIGLNYKIQKVGGVLSALAIERRVAEEVAAVPPCMVGGTFPTALGRAYDRVAARVLTSATLPADGWLPANSYFDGDRNLAAAEFADRGYLPVVVAGRRNVSGLGVVLDEQRVQQWKVQDFRGLYAAVRSGRSGAHLLIQLRGRRYADLYEQRALRPVTWNLVEAAA